MKHMMLASLILMSASVMAESPMKSDSKTPRELAKKMYVQLTGVQPNAAELTMIEDLISNGEAEEAGRRIVDQLPRDASGAPTVIKNGGSFYGVTLKDWATPKFNKQKTTLAPLNDSSATIIGYARDERAFNGILYENSVYKAAGSLFKGEVWYFYHANNGAVTWGDAGAATGVNVTGLCGAGNNRWKIIHSNPADPNNLNARQCKTTKYNEAALDAAYDVASLYLPHLDLIIETNLINVSNRHYEHITELGLDLSDPRLLVRTVQDTKLHTPGTKAAAGILSQRGFGSAYYFAGTNRAPVAYVMEHFMCKDMEALHDNTRPDFRNRQDVERSPGGSSELYKNRCIGCHAGMDAQAGAFAFYDYVQGKVVHTPGSVVSKMTHNALFTEGYKTIDDSWLNLWGEGNNKVLGWGSDTKGQGASTLGRMWAFTEAFHSCMAKQAYEKVCMKKVSNAIDKNRVAKLTDTYKASNYNLKKLFINASISCMED